MINNLLLINMIVAKNTTTKLINNFFAYRQDGGLEQVTIELVPNTVLEKK